MTPEQAKLESEIAGILRRSGVSYGMFTCDFNARYLCVTISLGGESHDFQVAVAHAAIVAEIDMAGYTPSVVVTP